MDKKYGADIPMGLGMALLQNPTAYNSFSALTEKQQQAVIDGTKNINSKEEMRIYVDGIPCMF